MADVRRVLRQLAMSDATILDLSTVVAGIRAVKLSTADLAEQRSNIDSRVDGEWTNGG